MSDQFCHEPLDLSTRSIRLLNIDGISDDGFVQCTIRTYNRDDTNCSYRALSYAWGPEEPSGSILLNEKPFRVRENLLLFLQEAITSHSEARRSIWIDAICIDQENISEKNHQVRQMADIFRNAVAVFAWLGPSKEDYNELSEFLEEIETTHLNTLECFSEPEKGKDNIIEDIGLVKINLLSRPYWKRMWIIQEIVLGDSNVRLLCG
ncbi:uncharacterized protein K452DRAFT_235310, partial [Aplosporella prunicola CBS 121167]